MRNELNEQDMDLVTGGTVYLNEGKNMCGFSTLGEKYELKCAFAQARNLLFQMLAQYPDIGEKEFDTKVRDAYAANGWI